SLMAWIFSFFALDHGSDHQISGGICAEIGISNTVGLDLFQAATAALLIASRSSRRAASQPYPFAMDTMSSPGMSSPGTPGVSSSTANDFRMQYSLFCNTTTNR